jgi:hypothetical protein
MEDIIKELEMAKSLLVVKESEGGKMLLDDLNKDATNSLDIIISNYKEWDHIRLITEIAKIEAINNLSSKLNVNQETVKLLETELEELKNNK